MANTLHNIAQRYFATLDASMDNSQTTVALASSGASGAPSVPFYAYIDSEVVEATAVAVDTPSAGKDTFTIVRAQQGTSASAHDAGVLFKQFASIFEVVELQNEVDALRGLLSWTMGNQDGVQRTDGATDLLTEETGTPGMTVTIDAGAGIVSDQPVYLASQFTTSTFTAPSVDPRIDVIEIDNDSAINILTGAEAGSPSAPSTTAGSLKLAEIFHRVGETSIKNTDDSTNGFITDSRVFI